MRTGGARGAPFSSGLRRLTGLLGGSSLRGVPRFLLRGCSATWQKGGVRTEFEGEGGGFPAGLEQQQVGQRSQQQVAT